MSVLPLDAQMREALQRSEEIVRALGAPSPGIAGVRGQAERARQWWNEGGPTLARVEDASVPGPWRDIPVRVYVPQESAGLLPAYVYFHGGGWRIGSPGSNDRQLRELAQAWGGIVISADYAHMPERTFPAPVEEAVAVYEGIARNGSRWGVDGQRLGFGGSSAGANVALGAFHAAPHLQPVLQCGAFVVGVFDDDLETESMRAYGNAGLFPDRESARVMFDEYAGSAAHRLDPRFNAMQGDPSRLPPLFLAAAECDVFRDSSMHLAARARQANRPVDLRVYPGVSHLFLGYSRMVDRAAECIQDIGGFLRTRLAPTASPPRDEGSR